VAKVVFQNDAVGQSQANAMNSKFVPPMAQDQTCKKYTLAEQAYCREITFGCKKNR
jgi:hypothetical protein